MVLRGKLTQSFDEAAPAHGPKWELFTSIIQVSLLALVVSCSNSPVENTDRVNHRFSTVSIASKKDLIFADTADIDSQSQKEITIVGGATGAVGGALIGAAACAPTGPYAALCAAAAVVPGAIAGLITGTVAANSWWHSGVSHEEALYLKEEALFVTGARDLNGELAEALRYELPDGMIKPALEADIQAIPVIEEIAFVKANDGLVGIKISAVLVFSEGKEGESVRHGHLFFSANSDQRLVDVWLGDGGNSIRNAIDKCLSEIAGKMANLMLEKRSS